jgi:hypothetical protein
MDDRGCGRATVRTPTAIRCDIIDETKTGHADEG